MKRRRKKKKTLVYEHEEKQSETTMFEHQILQLQLRLTTLAVFAIVSTFISLGIS